MKRSKPVEYSTNWTDDSGKEWDVVYCFEGSYYPGTLETPPEYPEPVVISMNGDKECDVPDALLNYIADIELPFPDEDDYYGED